MKEIPVVVLITGEEEYLVDQELVNLIEQITDQGQYEFEIIRLDGEEVDPQELEQQLKTVTLFSSAQIVTVKNPPWMGNPRGKKGKSVKDFEKVIISFLEHPNEGIYLIITCREATASNPVASAIKKKGEIREIKPFASSRLSTWITAEFKNRGLTVDRAVVTEMASSGRSMYYLLNEIERLELCCHKQAIGIDDITVDLETSGITSFKLTDSLLRKNKNEALKALAFLLQKGEPATLLVHMIGREFVLLGKVVAMRESGLTSSEIAKTTGQKPFRIDKMMDSRFNSMPQITRVFELLSEVDRKIKTTSQNDRLLLETLAIDICS